MSKDMYEKFIVENAGKKKTIIGHATNVETSRINDAGYIGIISEDADIGRVIVHGELEDTLSGLLNLFGEGDEEEEENPTITDLRNTTVKLYLEDDDKEDAQNCDYEAGKFDIDDDMLVLFIQSSRAFIQELEDLVDDEGNPLDGAEEFLDDTKDRFAQSGPPVIMRLAQRVRYLQKKLAEMEESDEEQEDTE